MSTFHIDRGILIERLNQLILSGIPLCAANCTTGRTRHQVAQTAMGPEAAQSLVDHTNAVSETALSGSDGPAR